MSQVLGVRRTRWVVAAVGVVVVAGAAVAVVQSRGSEPASSEQIAMTYACTQAAQEQLQPLVTIPSDEAKFQQQDGAWLVSTSVDHKTKWVDNWYDVTCMVQPPQTVVSVSAVRRQS